MRTETENQQFPVLALVFAIATTVWLFSGPRADGVQHGGYTVLTKNYAQIKAPKQGLMPPWMLEDAIKERLRMRPAKFKR